MMLTLTEQDIRAMIRHLSGAELKMYLALHVRVGSGEDPTMWKMLEITGLSYPWVMKGLRSLADRKVITFEWIKHNGAGANFAVTFPTEWTHE